MKFSLLFFILFIGLKSFSQSNQELVVQNIPISYETEKSNCYITSILTIGDKTYVTVDFIQIKMVGVDEEGFEKYKVINNNPKKRTYLIPNEDCLISPYDGKKTIDDIIEEAKDKNNWFVISASKGKVISLYVNGAG